MNRIILIGNGFDLAHGMKTSYKDFIDDLWKNYSLEINEYFSKNTLNVHNLEPELNFQNDDFIISQPKFKWDNVNSYDSLLNELEGQNSSITYKNYFLDNIMTYYRECNWVDIENLYYYLLKNIYQSKTKRYDIQNLNEDFDVVKFYLKEYLSKVEKENRDTINLRVKSRINNIIYSNIKSREFSSFNQRDNSIPDNTLLLSFNYTDTHYLYDESAETISIHGSLQASDENPIIFGFGDEIDEDYKAIENLNDNSYLENVKSIKYLETDNYRKLLEYINSGYYQIFIFGHSCGISDRTLLSTVFEHKNCVSIKPYYHQISKNKDNYSDIVRNISRNFGSKIEMRQKVVNKKYCQPLL